jgi:hypothetical protein
VCTSSAARISFVEEACICMGTKYHVTCLIDYAVIWIGRNIVKEEVHRLFCGNGGLGLACGDGAESNKEFVIDCPCVVQNRCHNFLNAAFAASIGEFQRVRIRCNVRLSTVGDGETLKWRYSRGLAGFGCLNLRSSIDI